MLKRTPTDRMLKQLLASWNEYDRSYKMYLRSREYKNLKQNWSDDQITVANFVLSVIKDKYKPYKNIRCKRTITSQDLQQMESES
jgi:hypothetical protein